MSRYEQAKEYAGKKWNDEAYSNAEEKDFVFTIGEQKRMSESDFLAGYNAAMEERNKVNEWHWPVKGNPIKGKKDTLYLLMLCSNSRLKYAFGVYTPAVCYWDEQWERFEILEETKGNRNVNPNDILA